MEEEHNIETQSDDGNVSIIDLTGGDNTTSSDLHARGVNWRFTVNNYTEADEVVIKHVVAPKCKWLIYGYEKAPTTGTPHLQGYAKFKGKQTKNVLIKMIPTPTWWGTCSKGDRINFEYVTKTRAEDPGPPNEFKEFGTRPEFHESNGAREKKRWEEILASAKVGNLEAVPAQVVVCHYSSLMRIQKDYAAMPGDLDDVCGVWIQGPSGCGKSRKARTEYPQAYFKSCNKWWDMYQKQPYVIMDDFEPSHSVLGHHLKIWADRYGFMAETKGSAIAIRPQKIVITTQYRMDDIWKDSETIEALKRRFKVVDMFPQNPPAMHPMFVTPASSGKRVRFTDQMNQLVQAMEEEVEDTQEVELPTVVPLTRSSGVLIRDGARTPMPQVTPTQVSNPDEQ